MTAWKVTLPSGDDDTVLPCLISESARKVDGQPEHITGDAYSRTGCDATVHRRHQIDRSQTGDEIERDPDCVIEAVGDEHHLVSDELHDATCVSRHDIEGCGLEGLDDLGDLDRRRPLADPREAGEIRKADRPASAD